MKEERYLLEMKSTDKRLKQAACEHIYIEYRGLVYGIAKKIVIQTEMAQEVCQDTFLQVFRYANDFKNKIVSKRGL